MRLSAFHECVPLTWYIFFCEVSIQVLCLFHNYSVDLFLANPFLKFIFIVVLGGDTLWIL
jgi:hypothetical protein